MQLSGHGRRNTHCLHYKGFSPMFQKPAIFTTMQEIPLCPVRIRHGLFEFYRWRKEGQLQPPTWCPCPCVSVPLTNLEVCESPNPSIYGICNNSLRDHDQSNAVLYELQAPWRHPRRDGISSLEDSEFLASTFCQEPKPTEVSQLRKRGSTAGGTREDPEGLGST